MSTNDLTEALRIAEQLRGFADPSRSERAIIALADEVDRLRASLSEAVTARNCAMRQRDEEARAKVGNIDALNAATIERDAARAALGRVTELLTLWARLASQQASLGDVVHDLTRALEGAGDACSRHVATR